MLSTRPENLKRVPQFRAHGTPQKWALTRFENTVDTLSVRTRWQVRWMPVGHARAITGRGP